MAATVWRGQLAFGLVSIPVRLYKAARRERIRFHHVYRPVEMAPEPEPGAEELEAPRSKRAIHELPKAPQRAEALPPGRSPEPAPVARVLSRPVAELSQTPLEKPQILKGHEVEKGRYVTFEPQELAALRPRTSTELDIVEFVRVAEIDPVFFDVSYYVAPDKGGEKAYAVLFQALTESAYAAMASLAMHGREHAAVIRPGKHGLILHTLFYVNEVHAEEEYRTAVDVAKPQEIEMAKAFVGALASPFEAARLKDTLEERLRQLIQTRDRTAYAGTMRREPLNRAPVVDITEALRKSLERLVKKPLQSEVAAPARKKMGRRAKR